MLLNSWRTLPAPHRIYQCRDEKKCKSVWTHFDTHNWLPVKRLLSTLPPFILFFDIYRERQLSIIHGCSGAVLGFLTMRDFCFQVFAVQLSTAAWLSYYAVQVQMVHTISLRFFFVRFTRCLLQLLALIIQLLHIQLPFTHSFITLRFIFIPLRKLLSICVNYSYFSLWIFHLVVQNIRIQNKFFARTFPSRFVIVVDRIKQAPLACFNARCEISDR